jgi:AcrR family transcriptional regulator
VRDVAAELGCSSGLIHHYFTSMDDVLATAFDAAAGAELSALQDVLGTRPDPLDRLAGFFESYARGDDVSFQLWLDAWAEAPRRPALRATSRRINVAWQELLASTFTDGVRLGVFRCDDPDAAAWRVLSLLDGLALQNVAHGDVLDSRTALGWCMRAAERELALAAGALDSVPAGVAR